MKKKILVVDDQMEFTQLVKMNLEQTGNYEVIIRNRGTEALSCAKSFKPDLILLDILMPDLGGGEVAKLLRGDPETKDIPIVFVSATVTQEEVEKSDGIIGGSPFLAKPVTVDQMVNVIEENTT